MGYIDGNNNKQNDQIWDILSQNKESTTLTNLKTFVTAIEGACFDWMLLTEPTPIQST